MRRLVFFAFITGCSSSSSAAPEPLPAIVSCTGNTAPGTDGACVESGITTCPAGFTLDAGACHAILPATPCAPGEMALPGETACRPVAPCASGDWYDAPASAIHVDAKAAAMGADGSMAAPYPTIAAALSAASSGATIALADGVYAESVLITKPVTIIGRCPSKVSIDAPEGSVATLDVEAPSTVRRVAVTGPVLGVSVYETEGFVGDQLWIHDTGSVGFDVERKTKTASAKLTRSLIEGVGWSGAIGIGGNVEIDTSIIRDTRRVNDDQRGIGVAVRPQGTEMGSLRVTGSLVERVREWGIATQTSPLTVENTLVRSVAEDLEMGAGIVSVAVVGTTPTTPIQVSLKGVVVEDVVGGGALFDRSELSIAGLTVRSIHHGTKLHSDGYGVVIERSHATWREGVIESVERDGLGFVGASGTVERVLVRDVRSLLSSNGFGVYAGGDDLGTPSDLTLRESRVDHTMTGGLLVFGANATIERCVFHDIAASGDGYGDGIEVSGDWDPGPDFVRAKVVLDSVQVDGAARAGLATFGGGDVTVTRSSFSCTAFDIEINEHADETHTSPVTLQDSGGTRCGCESEVRACRALSSSLAPVPPSAKTPVR